MDAVGPARCVFELMKSLYFAHHGKNGSICPSSSLTERVQSSDVASISHFQRERHYNIWFCPDEYNFAHMLTHKCFEAIASHDIFSICLYPWGVLCRSLDINSHRNGMTSITSTYI